MFKCLFLKILFAGEETDKRSAAQWGRASGSILAWGGEGWRLRIDVAGLVSIRQEGVSTTLYSEYETL